jgi:type IV pilus assembly protein PilQ
MKDSVRILGAGALVSVILLTMCAVCLGEDANSVEGVAPPTKGVLTPLEERLQKKISVDFRDTPIDDVIRIMAEQVDVDIIKSPNVTGNVTAKLTDVPLAEALSNILAAQGYGYVVSANMLRVAPLGEITAQAEKLVNRIYRVTYADAEEVTKALKDFLSPRGSISFNKGTSNIIITDSESKIAAIDTFIDEIDRVTPQILVEVRIYDITSTNKLDLGVRWIAGTDTFFAEDEEGNQVITPGSKTNPYVQAMVDSPTNFADASDNTIRFGIINDSLNIQTILTAEQEDVTATLLANPRILVLDNQTANFQAIREIPYQELTQTSGGGNIGTTEFREVGVFLNVIPHVTRDKMIRLRVMPEFSVVAGTVIIGGQLIQSPQPIVDSRKADTMLLVEDGQTIVLGGLRKKEATQETNKVPLLGDLPLLGWLFRYEGEEIVNSELVVFITPRVVVKPTLDPREAGYLERTEMEVCQPVKPDSKVDICENGLYGD